MIHSADPNERQIAEGLDEAAVPTSPERLAEAYRASEVYQRMCAEREAFRASIARETVRQEEFVSAVAEDKRAGVGKKSPYTVSIFTQVKALCVRQYVPRCLRTMAWD